MKDVGGTAYIESHVVISRNQNTKTAFVRPFYSIGLPEGLFTRMDIPESRLCGRDDLKERLKGKSLHPAAVLMGVDPCK